MKGGNVMAFASWKKALHDLGYLNDRTITVYFNAGDEESSEMSKFSRMDLLEAKHKNMK